MDSLFGLNGYRIRRLNPNQGIKPLDFGYDGCTGSINSDGRLIAINAYHSVHGYMTLTAHPPFADEDRYDVAKVRAYRRELAESGGFGLRFKLQVVDREAFLVEDAVPLLRFTLENGVVAECLTYVDAAAPNGFAHLWRFAEPGDWATWDGPVSLQRSAYTQLTEGGVVSFPSTATEVATFEGMTHIYSPALDSHVILSPALTFDGTMSIPGEEKTFDVSGSGPFESLEDAHTSHALTIGNDRSMTLDIWRTGNGLSPFDPAETEPGDSVLLRAWTYARQCSVSIDQGSQRCLLTDHMLLPLSWNRDAYYVAKLCLLNRDTTSPLVQGHLRWTFERAERPDGYWGRSYLANGLIKDNGYQLDQQTFPLLEFAEYVAATDNKALFSRLQPVARGVLDWLLDQEDSRSGLFRTDETPADDPLDDFPFHFSSHILLWHTLRQLSPLFDHLDLMSRADDLKQRIERSFIVDDSAGNRLYAYAVDGRGNSRLYHDANDIPLVMMPLWGYCDSDNSVWRSTIEFAFSPENAGGFYSGVLGSVHSTAPWPLGDSQELILCKVIGDRERYQLVWERVQQAAQWDGALPEAYDADTFDVYSRTWFAWPNAMVALASAIPWNREKDLS